MEPFPVICETCHARLKIRSESVIGQIHGCPKCGSMVHIVPPLGWKASGGASPSAEAAAPATSGVELPAAVVNAPEATSFEMMPSDGMAAVQPTGTAADVVPVGAATPAVWSPLVWASAVGAAVLVGGVIAFAVWPVGNTSEVDAMPAATPTPETSELASEAATLENDDDVPEGETTNSEASDSETRVDAEAREEAPPESVASAANDSHVTPSNDATSPASPLGDQPDRDADSQVTPPVTDTSDRSGQQPTRAPVLRFDPLDFEPSLLSLSATGSPSARTPSASVPNDSAADEGATSERETDVDATVAIPPPESVNPTIAVRIGPVAIAADEQHTLASRLALRLGTFEVKEMPLARFVDVLSDMAGVPITLDPIVLELAGVSSRDVVTATVRGITLDDLLRDTLAKHRLEIQEREGHALVALAGGDRRLTRDYTVDDLVESGQSNAETIARMIEQFVAPTTWDAGGGSGTMQVDGTQLRVDQAKFVHHEVLIFCERLRVARGLAPKSRYPINLLSVESPYAQLHSRLDDQSTFTLLPWTRLADVVRHWQEASGVTILVDWRALADVQLGPETPISCSAIDRPWSDALGEILEQLHSAWYAVDGETIAITSQDAVEDLERVEFYSVPKALRDQFASEEAIVATLRDELQEVAGHGPRGAADIRMALDGPSGRLICRGAPAVHRHLARRLSLTAE